MSLGPGRNDYHLQETGEKWVITLGANRTGEEKKNSGKAEKRKVQKQAERERGMEEL